MTASNGRPARTPKAAARRPNAGGKPKRARKPKPAPDRASLIFRDFVRQLEKLDSGPTRDGAR